jgi:predicted nucleic acid-binding protein
MSDRYGTDTSILVRLLTGDPEREYQRTVERLMAMIERDPGTQILVSNAVIGEAYIAVQHHYGATKAEARAALLSVFESGLVAPLNGQAVLAHIGETSGCGLVDRLIADDYEAHRITTLTLGRRMARLENTRRL